MHRRFSYFMSAALMLVSLSTVFIACSDDETYAEQKERERMAAQRRHQRNRARRISSEILESLEY